MKRIISALFIVCGLISSASALADITGATKATATLNSFCQITASNIDLGDVTPTATSDIGWKSTTQVIGTVTATCSNGTGYTLALNRGVSNNRLLTSPTTSDSLAFTICLTNSFVGQLGCANTWSGGSVYSGTGNGLPQSIPMYTFLKKAFVAPGNYKDTMTVTINY